jgi:hypothetical protein
MEKVLFENVLMVANYAVYSENGCIALFENEDDARVFKDTIEKKYKDCMAFIKEITD